METNEGNIPPRRPGRHLLIALGSAAALLAALGFGLYKVTRPAAPVFRTTAAVRADITQQITATGTVQPVLTSPVGAQVSGIIATLHADFNSKVKAGDLLVELDPALFQNAVTVASAGLTQARADFNSAQATAKGARVIHDRTMNLGRQLLVSRADMDAATATFDMAEGLERAGAAQVASARGQLDRARLDLAHSIIRSPVAGTVISRNIDVGQAVASSLTAPTLFTIAQDLHKMQVHAAVDEADIGQVRPGQSATFTVDAFRGETFKAVVNEVRNSPQTAQNVVTYDVVIDVDNPEEKLRPGMTANVLILIVQKLQVVAVSNEALRFRPAGAKAGASEAKTADGLLEGAVYVPDKAKAVRVPIRSGITDGNLTEVEGLDPGRQVIIDVLRDKTKAKAGGAGHGI